MFTDNKTEWYKVYKKLADELAKFYTDWNDFRNKTSKHNYEKGNEHFSRFINFDQNKSAGEIFYEKCKIKPEFFNLFNWAKNISEESLDPFHIFVSFNNNNTILDTKRKRLQFYFDVLGCEINVDNFPDNRTSVPHIPVMQLLTNRTKETQEEIWKFFVGILNNNEEVIKQGFQNYKKWYGIGFVVITEMLFWVDSSKYISLDKNTSKLLLKDSVIDKIPNDYETYIELLNKKNSLNLSDNIFRLLVKHSYDEQVLENNSDRDEIFKFISKKENIEPIPIEKDIQEQDNQQIIQNLKFQLIAIKVLDNENKKYTKNLLKDELYQFNKNFEFENDVIKYYKKRDMDLYKIDDIDININVIVGENGSGKSTLLELAFMIINNVSKRIFEKNGLKNEESLIKYIDEINAELYFVTDHLYKIIIEEKELKVEKFEKIDFTNEIITLGNPSDYTTKFSLDNLYYTNHINYSLHSLNENYFGYWIYDLFYKNSYETPIILEPYRDKGNIDINLLQSLMKTRLLSYVLDNSNESFRQLTKKAKAKKIVLTVDYFKFLSIKSNNVPTKEDFTNLAKNLTNVFNFDTREVIKIINEFIDNPLNKVSFDENQFINDGDDLLLKANFKDVPIEFFFMMYIFYKLHSIVKKYKEFEKYKNYKNENNLEELLEAIKKDTSHVTYKIRQAIYNLKYLDTLNFQNIEIPFEIDELSNILANEILAKESAEDSDLRIDDLIPSSIFKVDIILENDESFDSLSSGEKQKIFVLNSIMYHLKNIASKDNGYRYINIVLDEIELYFHPEMQRDFLNDLLEMLKNNDYINNLNALNFIFITHSPFILSDVIDNNLLMLNQFAQPLKENKKTFGANLYDLLHDGFFMEDGFIGKFAEKKIKHIIDIIKLYKALKAKEDTEEFIESYKDFFGKKAKTDNTKILSHIEESKNKLLKIVDSIGEPLLRNKLEEEIKTLFEIDDITEIVNSLKNKKNEEIEKELEKYSQFTQTKVLMKLLEIRK